MVKLLIDGRADLQATDNVSGYDILYCMCCDVQTLSRLGGSQLGRTCLHMEEVIKNISLLRLLVDSFQDQEIRVEQYAKVWCLCHEYYHNHHLVGGPSELLQSSAGGMSGWRQVQGGCGGALVGRSQP